MLEKNLKHLGDTIHSIRVRLNISQKELAEGICSQSQISKIEAGQISPYVDTLVKISKKLGICPAYFLNIVYKDQYHFITSSKKSIRKAISAKDYREVKRLVDKYEKHPSFQDIEEKQFLKWHKGIAVYYLDQKFHESVKILREASSMKDSIQHTEQDIQILNSLAIIYSEEEQWVDAKSKFEEAIEVFNKSIFIDDITISIRLSYNLSKLLYSINEYNDGLFYCNKGLEQCKKHHSSYLFGELLYQKGITLSEIGNKREGIKHLKYAFNAFELLEKDDYLEITNQKINELNSTSQM
ncbi:helix-turn-helix domain-containing protein [Mesobacillus maritimus]|uniref:helix-turn-helix domain-containing protein n=1 Tax=Mesobacillus maritimus TaxID=1643336 RepID=UPI00203EB97A|nr:helix-turn-helix domain-containing protein [Mesobacillus maritimus]MCM3670942.1 helix-turn-helix domain-containing protein [Mesobacillus maritimus]